MKQLNNVAIAAERSLLNCLMQKPSLILDIDGNCITDDIFSSILTRCIYNGIRKIAEDSLSDESRLIDETVLEDRIKSEYSSFYKHQSDEFYDMIKTIKNSQCAEGELSEYIRIIVTESYKNKAIVALKTLEKSLDGIDNPIDIINTVESKIFEFTNGLVSSNGVEQMSAGIDNFLTAKIEQAKAGLVDVGISSGYKNYDMVIGGGYRKGTINVIAARAKVGKSWWAINAALNAAKNNIPSLYLDTELSKDYQLTRSLAILSGVGLNDIDKASFCSDKNKVDKILEAKKKMESIPFDYVEIRGWTLQQQVSCIRRWITKKVGKNGQGKYNPCLIILDYLKLMDPSDKGYDTKEWEALGYRMSALHDLMGDYDASMVMLAQQNRDGTSKEDSTTISGSDRIIWLCDSFGMLINKTYVEIAAEKAKAESLGTNKKISNMRIKVTEARFGSGTQDKYIGMYNSVKDPRLKDTEKTGLFEEIGMEVPIID